MLQKGPNTDSYLDGFVRLLVLLAQSAFGLLIANRLWTLVHDRLLTEAYGLICLTPRTAIPM
jgi:hypothetical protein